MTQFKMTIKSLFIILLFASCKVPKRIILKEDYKKFYDKYEVDGCFVLYNQNEKSYCIYNQNQFEQEFTPASTFKICNTLIGLETGVITDENFMIPWDSVVRQVPKWNANHDLKTAFKNSTVWYYQEIARRVGEEKMQFWVNKLNYGNQNIDGGIDKFWLTGDLRITPKQEIDFLVELNNNKLPILQKNMDVLKKIMLVSDTNEIKIYAKTGWGSQNNLDVGWYVGFIETKENVYYFANCIQTSNLENQNFAQARKEITQNILKNLGIIPENQ
jgi:beta-lactamase class D